MKLSVLVTMVSTARGLAAALGAGMLFLGVQAGAEQPNLNAVGPPLHALQTKIADPNWLVAWLLKPSRLRPGTTMPDFEVTAEEAQSMARFLLSGAGAMKATAQWQGGDAKAGAKLFVSRGCRGCHATAAGERPLSPRVPHLGDIGIKAKGEWLFAWIRSPRSYNPRSAMPQLALRDEEIRHLVAFLLSQRNGSGVVAGSARYDASVSTGGARAALERYECAKCHEMPGFPSPTPAFSLSSTQLATEDAALQDGRALVEYYGCRGCHRIEGSGGAIADFLERKTFAPPTLEGEGARVQYSWLVGFLRHPTTLRPWLDMRMPDYGLPEAEAVAIARYFAALAKVPAADEPHPAAAAESIARGLRRLAHFKCAQCHPMQPEIPAGTDPENLSINLNLAKTRLRPSWLRDFLARPKSIVGTQTRMPTVFYSTDGVPKVEHPDKDIEDVAASLMRMTEPLDVALARLGEERKVQQEKRQVDWSKVDY